MHQPRDPENGRFTAALTERVLEEFRKAHAQEHRSESRALQLQSKEYERRLTELNHAHAQAVQKEKDYVQVDKFDDAMTRLDTAAKRLEERIDAAAGILGERVRPLEDAQLKAATKTEVEKTKSTGNKALIGSVVSGVVAVASFIYGATNGATP